MGHDLDPDPGALSSGVRTFFVFLNLPKHLELRAGNLPLLEPGTVLDMDVTVRDPKGPERAWKVQGPHRVVRRLLRFSQKAGSKSGLSQYLELETSDPAVGPSKPGGGGP